MHFVRYTVALDYLVRAIKCMIRNGGIMTRDAISAAENIPENYLVKLLKHVSQTGIVRSRKGFNGGYEVVNRDVTVGDIWATMPLALDDRELRTNTKYGMAGLIANADKAVAELFTTKIVDLPDDHQAPTDPAL